MLLTSGPEPKLKKLPKNFLQAILPFEMFKFIFHENIDSIESYF